jgi:hypothetical protein
MPFLVAHVALQSLTVVALSCCSSALAQELSRNAPKPFTRRDILETLVIRNGGVVKLWQELQVHTTGASELIERVQQWYRAVGGPAKQMVYALPDLARG